MRILVLGGSGLLGTEVAAEARARGHEVFAPRSSEFDLTDPMASAELAMQVGRYDWCVNCAAYTAVDKAETEVRAATELNQLGPSYLASACNAAGIKLIHVSTDFVFDGECTSPYVEDSPTRALGVYGQTKLEGERAVIEANPNSVVVRTAWLFGPNGACFPKTMIRIWQSGKPLRVVSDQFGCPTYTPHLAKHLVELIERNVYPGIYHLCGPDAMSWYEFASRTLSACRSNGLGDMPIDLTPIPTEDYPTPAKRPQYSVLSCEKLAGLGFAPLPELNLALAEFMRRLHG